MTSRHVALVIISENTWMTLRSFWLVCWKPMSIKKGILGWQVLHQNYFSEFVFPLRLAYGSLALCAQMFPTPCQTGAV